MNGLGRRLVTNTLHAATGRVAGLLVWVVFTPAILRALGVEGFGVWSLFYALTGYFATLDFGLVQGTVRHVAASREQGRHEEAGAFATLAVLGYLALGALWITLSWLLQDAILGWLRIPGPLEAAARFALLTGAGVFVLAGCANVTMAVAQGYGRFDLANRVLLAITFQQAAGFALVLDRRWGLQGLVVNVGIGWALGGVVGLASLKTALPMYRWGTPRAAFGRLGEALRFGGPMQITNLLAVINLHVDKLLLSRFVALALVAPYELGSRVASGISTLPQLILLAVLPEAAAMHAAGDRERLRELYDRGNRYVLTAVAVVFAPLLGAGDRLFTVWLGAAHADAALALRVLTVGLFFSLATGLGTTVARGIGRTDLETWFAVVTVSLHVALSLWLLPVIGLPGALIAVLVGTLAGAALFMVLLGRTLEWPLLRTLLGPCVVPLLALGAGGAAGWAVDRALPAAGGVTGWALLAAVATVAAGVALTGTIATGYFRWREARSLLLARG